MKTILSALEEKGFDLIEARDGIEGIKGLEHNPDLIWLDLYLPKMDGLEFLKILQDMPEHADTPVVIATVSKNMDEIAHDIKRVNIVKDFIKSEVPLGTIVEEISNFFEKE